MPNLRIVGLLLLTVSAAEAGCATTGPMSTERPSGPDASAVQCSQFSQDQAGVWRTTQATRVGPTQLAANSVVPYGIRVNGVDLTVILNGKCAAQAQPSPTS